MAGRLTPSRRRAAWLVLLAAVLLLHLIGAQQLADSHIGDGAATPTVQRIEVAFVRELQSAAPPMVAPVIVARRSAAAPPDPAASAAQAARANAAQKAARETARARAEAQAIAEAPAPAEAVASAAAPAVVAAATPNAAAQPAASSLPVTSPSAEAVLAASAPLASAGAASAPQALPDAKAFDWPPSTRLRYVLTGNYRGEVHGNAQVQWVRQGPRYQVHLDVNVGPSFAPLIKRRMSSDGELTDRGLAPRRYDEDTKVAFREPRRIAMRFEPDAVVMANGSRRATLAGVQDSASQFVQLTWLFTTQPSLLRAGNTVELPLALLRHVDIWVYDVVGEETLQTPIGPIETYHVKPRRQAVRGSDLTVELWFAPSLQYLPVRLRIRQDDETYVDLLIESRPLQAEPR